MSTTVNISPAKPKLPRRLVKHSSNPNDEFPNASLSVRDVHLILRELENYEKRITAFKDRDAKTARRRVRKLIDKLYQVRWS